MYSPIRGWISLFDFLTVCLSALSLYSLSVYLHDFLNPCPLILDPYLLQLRRGNPVPAPIPRRDRRGPTSTAATTAAAAAATEDAGHHRKGLEPRRRRRRELSLV